MSLTPRPQPNAPFTNTLAPAPVSHRPLQTSLRASQRASLSARQLFDVELGLVLLSQLLPAAPPDHLPALLSGDTADQPGDWTSQQRRCLSRGRALLRPFQQSALWNDLLDRYIRLTNPVQAFDISHDGCRFQPKSVGFFRNRVFTLRQLLA